MAGQYSQRSSGVKRLQAEYRQLQRDGDCNIHAAPVADDLFDWHFTVRFDDDDGAGDFRGGVFHGRITLPASYPFKPPDLSLLTPNGRFELNKKICLTITGYHEESWQPAWGIRTALVALMSFFHTEAKGAIGGLDTAPEERRRLALLSKDWCCPTCACKNSELLPLQQRATESTPSMPTVPASAENQATADLSDEAVKEEPSVETIPAVPLPASPSSSPIDRASDLPFDIATATSAMSHISLHTRLAGSAGSSTDNHPKSMSSAQGTSSALEAIPNREEASLHCDTRHGPTDTVSASTSLPAILSSSTQAVLATSLVEREAEALSPPPVWLDGMIGLVLVALASLLCRKIL